MAGLSGNLGVAHAAARPYRVSLIGDSFDGEVWRTGVRVEMDEGWKTYWRMPGEAGIPPQFTWTASPGTGPIEVSFPVPGRFQDASGETVGYKHEVVFPVTVRPGSASMVKLGLDLFLAVCKDICIPAQAQAAIELGSASHDPKGSVRVETWLAKLPTLAGIVTSVSYAMDDAGRPQLLLALGATVDDIFAETATPAYFRAPEFSGDGRLARMVADNVKDFSALRGTELKLTFKRGDAGLEQTLMLP